MTRATAPATADPAVNPPRPARRQASWDDAPLRVKVTLLVLLASVGGALAGMIEAHLGHAVWPLALALALLVLAVLRLARAWVWKPIHRLIAHLDHLGAPHKTQRFDALPTHRHDEVGQLARALRDLSLGSLRHRHDAQQLRRTLDDRIDKATRRATRQLTELTMRDPLTGLGNRRFLDAHLGPLVELCHATGTDLSALAIDLDHFKQVNDAQGHERGDELLRFLADLLRANIRAQDYALRLGGDEFLLLLPACDAERAGELARHLIQLFARHVRDTQEAGSDGASAGLSAGVASLQRDGLNDAADLLRRADARLYDAKRQGRGRCAGG